MFVLNRNERTLYPNQLIMMNAVMSDILNNQKSFINGTNNNYNSKILETQSIVAGLLESDTPIKETKIDISGYNNIVKGQPVTQELLEKNLKVFKEFEKSLKLIDTNLQTLINGLDPITDAEILKILTLYKSIFVELSDIFKLIKTKKFLLSDEYLIKINEVLGILFTNLSRLTSSKI